MHESLAAIEDQHKSRIDDLQSLLDQSEARITDLESSLHQSESKIMQIGHAEVDQHNHSSEMEELRSSLSLAQEENKKLLSKMSDGEGDVCVQSSCLRFSVDLRYSCCWLRWWNVLQYVVLISRVNVLIRYTSVT